MNHQQTNIEMEAVKDPRSVDAVLKTFWEKVQAASEMIARLRSEQRALLDRVAMLEKDANSLRSELLLKEQELKRLKIENAQLSHSNGSDYLTQEEKENLKAKIREFIAKINSHL